ncbi:hypothetical protein I4U23_021463 [Adineta vaga]|nr:hypothetical protein I4U23_021463 [Adineta vaga]
MLSYEKFSLGKSTYVHVFFFGETAERSWILTSRILPFIGASKFTKQRNDWRRKMKVKIREEQKLTLKDRSNLNTAIKQAEKLAKFSLRKRINILKTEWWYWNELVQSEGNTESSIEETSIDQQTSIVIQNQESDNEEILQLFNSTSDDLDDIICLSDTDTDTRSSLQHTTSVCFHPLTSHEEETIIREMLASSDNSYSACRRVAEQEYLLCIQKNFPSTSIISEHWFYLFVFRHCERLARHFSRWINDMEVFLTQSSFLPRVHVSQVKSLIILFKQYNQSHQEQSSSH